MDRWENEGGQVANDDAGNDLLTPSQVAQVFSVNPKTVTRWAKSGKLTSFRTLGGHRRFKRAEVEALRDGSQSHGEDPVSGDAPLDAP